MKKAISHQQSAISLSLTKLTADSLKLIANKES
jgi:hypothetical protein